MNFKTNGVELDETCIVAPNATLIGEISAGADCSFFPGAVLRADGFPIMLGERTNIQDNAVVHIADAAPCTIGSDVTVGHGAIVHGCTVGDATLVGMGAIIMNHAMVGRGCIIGAGALVPENMVIPDQSVVVGVPARVIRSVSDEDVQAQIESAARYVETARTWADDGIFSYARDLDRGATASIIG